MNRRCRTGSPDAKRYPSPEAYGLAARVIAGHITRSEAIERLTALILIKHQA